MNEEIVTRVKTLMDEKINERGFVRKDELFKALETDLDGFVQERFENLINERVKDMPTEDSVRQMLAEVTDAVRKGNVDPDEAEIMKAYPRHIDDPEMVKSMMQEDKILDVDGVKTWTVEPTAYRMERLEKQKNLQTQGIPGAGTMPIGVVTGRFNSDVFRPFARQLFPTTGKIDDLIISFSEFAATTVNATPTYNSTAFAGGGEKTLAYAHAGFRTTASLDEDVPGVQSALEDSARRRWNAYRVASTVTALEGASGVDETKTGTNGAFPSNVALMFRHLAKMKADQVNESDGFEGNAYFVNTDLWSRIQSANYEGVYFDQRTGTTTLFDDPLIHCPAIPATANTKIAAYYAPWSRALIQAERPGLVIMANPYTVPGMTTIYARCRFLAYVQVPGAVSTYKVQM